jgi:heme-degrading monooxygenase HmoA
MAWDDATVQLVIFEYRLRDDADRAAYSALNEHLYEVVRDPRYGFIGDESLERPDGSRVVLEWFEHAEGIELWYLNPEHRAAQQRGREEFYEWYRVRRCTVDREYQRGRVPAVAAS